MSKVLDSSAVLALLQRERGMDLVLDALPLALISAVNLAEVVTKMVEKGESDEAAVDKTTRLSLNAIPFDQEQAVVVGQLRRSTASLGLSLGDRACLALAIREKLPVMTADRAWAALDLGVEVVLIR